ncbi:MAG: septal ring lytic transglycosylase RlpA family protein [Leptospiraceae bacterium]|nr:septal ring lytic transglycosylase RlpA family protein [Leptospiraceae bacterium]
MKLLFLLFFPCLLFAQSLGEVGYREEGIASYYGVGFHGRTAASGEIYNQDAFTCAHPYLPFNTIVKITVPRHGRAIILRVNDRGPYIQGRIVDVSLLAGRYLDMIQEGVTPAVLEVIDPKSPVGPVKGVGVDHLLSIEDLMVNAKADQVLTENDAYKLPPISYSSNHFMTKNGKKIDPVGFGVQVFSLRKVENIISNTDALEAKGYRNLIIENVSLPTGGTAFRIIVGPFENIKDADKILEKLIADGFQQPFVYSFQ